MTNEGNTSVINIEKKNIAVVTKISFNLIRFLATLTNYINYL